MLKEVLYLACRMAHLFKQSFPQTLFYGQMNFLVSYDYEANMTW